MLLESLRSPRQNMKSKINNRYHEKQSFLLNVITRKINDKVRLRFFVCPSLFFKLSCQQSTSFAKTSFGEQIAALMYAHKSQRQSAINQKLQS